MGAHGFLQAREAVAHCRLRCERGTAMCTVPRDTERRLSRPLLVQRDWQQHHVYCVLRVRRRQRRLHRRLSRRQHLRCEQHLQRSDIGRRCREGLPRPAQLLICRKQRLLWRPLSPRGEELQGSCQVQLSNATSSNATSSEPRLPRSARGQVLQEHRPTLVLQALPGSCTRQSLPGHRQAVSMWASPTTEVPTETTNPTSSDAIKAPVPLL